MPSAPVLFWSIVSIAVLSLPSFAHADTAASQASAEETSQGAESFKHFVGPSAFMSFNWILPEEDAPSFYQLNYGHRLTPKDVLIVEAITWTYKAPLGIPQWDEAWGKRGSEFPGYVRDYGVGLAYQRYWWKGFYSTLHATPFWQLYYDEEDQYIQSGFQLFMSLRAGYHFSFLGDRVWIEPSLAATAWPINTNLPEAFAKKENPWPSYLLFEPGLNLGVNF